MNYFSKQRPFRAFLWFPFYNHHTHTPSLAVSESNFQAKKMFAIYATFFQRSHFDQTQANDVIASRRQLYNLPSYFLFSVFHFFFDFFSLFFLFFLYLFVLFCFVLFCFVLFCFHSNISIPTMICIVRTNK